MCEITGKSKLKSATGYKVVIEEDNKIYSSSTGIEYKIGPVEIATKYGKHSLVPILNEWSDILDKKNNFYNKKYIGNTAVFINKNDAEYLINAIDKQLDKFNDSLEFPGYICNLKIVKMTLSKNIKCGVYYDDNSYPRQVYLGKNIDNIEMTEK